MGLIVVDRPQDEPVTLAEARAHLRLATGQATDQNATISRHIRAAREHAEAFTRRAFMLQTLRLTLDQFPDFEIALPRPPLVDVSQIRYLDPTTGAMTVLAGSEYSVDNTRAPGWVFPAYGRRWPTTRSFTGAVEITYTAGYADIDEVPEDLKQAVLLLVSHFYENREPEISGTIVSAWQLGAERLLERYRDLGGPLT